MWRAVCLLRSRRRTFLLTLCFYQEHYEVTQLGIWKQNKKKKRKFFVRQKLSWVRKFQGVVKYFWYHRKCHPVQWLYDLKEGVASIRRPITVKPSVLRKYILWNTKGNNLLKMVQDSSWNRSKRRLWLYWSDCLLFILSSTVAAKYCTKTDIHTDILQPFEIVYPSNWTVEILLRFVGFVL